VEFLDPLKMTAQMYPQQLNMADKMFKAFTTQNISATNTWTTNHPTVSSHPIVFKYFQNLSLPEHSHSNVTVVTQTLILKNEKSSAEVN